MSLKLNFLWLLVSRATSAAVSFLTWALANRALGAENRGLVGEIQTWLGLFIVVFGFGLDSAIYHFANKERYGADDSARLITILSLIFFYALLGALALFGLSCLWPGQFSVTALRYMVPICILFIFQLINLHLITFMLSMGQVRFAAYQQLGLAVINLSVIGFGYRMELIDIFYILINLLIVQLTAFFISLVFFCRLKLFSGRFSLSLAKDLVCTGLKPYIAIICTFVYTKINQLMVLHYSGARETGLFTVSVNLAFSLIFIPATLQTALYPRVIHAHDDYEITIRTLRFGFYGWGVVVLGLILLAQPILSLYGGEQFLAAVPVFRWHMLAVWFLPLSSLIAPYYIKLGEFIKSTLTAVMLGVISLSLNFWLVPRYAARGAAVATAISCFIGFILALALFYHLSRKKIWTLFLPDFRAELAFFKKKNPKKICTGAS